MKVNYQNQNICMALSKRPKSGDKDKYQTIMNNKNKTKYKCASYFQSPNKGEHILFIKKKFKKLKKIKKRSNDKIKNKTTNNTNNNSNNKISSSYISFMSPINEKYCKNKQNNALTRFLKNQIILNSKDNSSLISSKEKEKNNDKDNRDKEKVLSYNNSSKLINMLENNINNKNNKVMNNNENINNLNNLKINYYN